MQNAFKYIEKEELSNDPQTNEILMDYVVQSHILELTCRPRYDLISFFCRLLPRALSHNFVSLFHQEIPHHHFLLTGLFLVVFKAAFALLRKVSDKISLVKQ